MAHGALDGMLGTEDAGETRLKLDLVPHDLFVRATEWGGQVAGMVSEEVAVPHRIPDSYPRGKYLLVFDPLDGSSNIDINGTAGSIFSILRAPEPADEHRARTRFCSPAPSRCAPGTRSTARRRCSCSPSVPGCTALPWTLGSVSSS